MKIEQIKTEVKKALAGDKVLLLEKYTSSEGQIKDYVIRLLPDDGYINLVKESLEILNNEAEKFLRDIRPSSADAVEWAKAAAEQIASFSNSLNPDKEKKNFNFKNPLVKDDGLYFYESEFKDGNINTVIIKNAQVLSSTNHSEEAEDKLPKGNIARYKYLIRAHLPVSKYVAQFILSPGKVETVKAVSMQ